MFAVNVSKKFKTAVMAGVNEIDAAIMMPRAWLILGVNDIEAALVIPTKA